MHYYWILCFASFWILFRTFILHKYFLFITWNRWIENWLWNLNFNPMFSTNINVHYFVFIYSSSVRCKNSNVIVAISSVTLFRSFPYSRAYSLTPATVLIIAVVVVVFLTYIIVLLLLVLNYKIPTHSKYNSSIHIHVLKVLKYIHMHCK